MDIHDAYEPFLGYFRGSRNARFVSIMNLTPETTVLDVGGTAQYWSSMPVMPRITLLNLEWDKNSDLPQIVGSACELPCEDKSYDIVFSNSMIEHLGTWENQRQAANEMVRVGKRIWIQTPNKWFLVEPHLITPFIHWLPRTWQRALLPYTMWGLIAKPDASYCDGFMREIRLLTLTEMRKLFPGFSIICEKFVFMNKSLIAIGMT